MASGFWVRRVGVEVGPDADGNLDLENYGEHCKLLTITVPQSTASL